MKENTYVTIHEKLPVIDGCQGCPKCCCGGMGTSIILNPYDVYRFYDHLGLTLEDLLAGPVELHVEDGLVLPNLRMQPNTDACGYLDENNRCRIHAFRPDVCRLFPLARHYTDSAPEYFQMKGVCPKADLLKDNAKREKIEDWICAENADAYETYICAWHKLMTETKNRALKQLQSGEKDAQGEALNVRFLKWFYLKPYESGDFFAEFYSRRKTWQTLLR